MSYLKLPHSQELLSKLPEPKSVWEFFLLICEIPHGSWNCGPITKKIQEIAADLKLECIESDGNIIIKKAASPGAENAKPVCLQVHMDMVCQAIDGVNIDFKSSPIVPYIDGDLMKAKDTSLGSDDGIGLAMILGLFSDKTFDTHPAIELLITRDEEVGLVGAFELKPGLLKSKYLINIDSEEDNAICIGCAGGFSATISVPIKKAKQDSNCTCYHINLSGCVGGHSGCDIHLGRGNAVPLLARLLKSAHTSASFNLIDLKGGNAHNAIPRSCYAKVSIPTSNASMFTALMNEQFALVAKEHRKTDPQIKLDIKEEKCEDYPNVLDSETTLKIINFVNAIPYGVARMSPVVPDLVEVSSNLGVAGINTETKNTFDVLVSARSFTESQRDMLYDQLHAVASTVGGELSAKKGAYPGWVPDLKSPLLHAAKEQFEKVKKYKPRIYAIHAGLECGLIQAKYPDMQAISIGPTLTGPHSPDEALSVSSVAPTYEFIKAILKALAK